MNRNRIEENLWLSYFNQHLFEEGFLDERMRNKMKLAIENRK